MKQVLLAMACRGGSSLKIFRSKWVSWEEQILILRHGSVNIKQKMDGDFYDHMLYLMVCSSRNLRP